MDIYEQQERNNAAAIRSLFLAIGGLVLGAAAFAIQTSEEKPNFIVWSFIALGTTAYVASLVSFVQALRKSVKVRGRQVSITTTLALWILGTLVGAIVFVGSGVTGHTLLGLKTESFPVLLVGGATLLFGWLGPIIFGGRIILQVGMTTSQIGWNVVAA